MTTLRAEAAVPQWFDDDDYEEAAGVELPPADSNEYPELAFLLGSEGCDCAVAVCNASDDECTSTEAIL